MNVFTNMILSAGALSAIGLGAHAPKLAADPLTPTQQMEAAGIPVDQWGYVDYVISHESSWRPDVWNSSGSGAYGLCQAWPASKMASAGGDYMTNPITQLKWCDGYAKERYGGWFLAYLAWTRQGWW